MFYKRIVEIDYHSQNSFSNNKYIRFVSYRVCFDTNEKKNVPEAVTQKYAYSDE